jgi:integrase
MAEKKALTHTFIKDYPTPEKRIEIYDKVASGMVLRITKTGHKSFAYRYWYDETSKQRTIGTFGDYTLAEAREIAKEYRKALDEGLDPMAEKQKNRNEKPITLGEYIERFKNDYVERKLKASTQKTYKSRLNKVSSNKLSSIPLKDIDRPDVRSFLKGEAKQHPTNANRLQAILSKLFNEAIEDGHITKNPLKGMDKLTDEQPRDVNYNDDNIKAIWGAFEKEWEPMQSLLKMLLITGQRLGETSKMKWDDIHNSIWRIPQIDTKNKTAHEVPLPNIALELLKKMKSINNESEYVFASKTDKTEHLTQFANVIERIRIGTMLNDYRIHDLRHIVATKMIDLGIEFIHVGKVLNHKGLSASNAITSRYINTNMINQKTNALKVWAGHLSELTSSLSLVKKSS